jgi:hypothetical protein
MKCLTCKENYYLSHVKNDYCSTCYDENIINSLYNIWYYNLENKKSECLYNNKYCNEITSLDKPYMIYNTFECVESCPSKYKYYLGYYCVDECNKENMKSNGVKCECNSGYKININKEQKLIECIKDCPNLYDIEYNECVDSCPSKHKILFNNTCYKKCPLYTKEIIKNNIQSCECENQEYVINYNNKKYIVCTYLKKCPENTYIYHNKCVSKCSKFKYENICYEKCPNELIPVKDKCIEMKDLINNIEDYVKLFYMENIYIENENWKIEVYNSIEHKEMKNKSIIDLSECENIIREKYKMIKSDYFVILKIEIKRNDNPTNQIEYAIFNNQFKRIDLSICSETNMIIRNVLNFTQINYNSMISLGKNGYDIFNPNDDFYNNVCSKYKTINGRDIINKDRKYDFFQNYSLCEENCKYNGLNFNDYTINCICSVKINITTNNNKFNFLSIYEIFYNPFYYSNLKVIQCYQHFFKLYNLYKNIGQILCFISIGIEIYVSFYFMKYGMDNIIKMINKVIIKKNKEDNLTKIKTQPVNPPKKSNENLNDKTLKIQQKIKTKSNHNSKKFHNSYHLILKKN